MKARISDEKKFNDASIVKEHVKWAKNELNIFKEKANPGSDQILVGTKWTPKSDIIAENIIKLMVSFGDAGLNENDINAAKNLFIRLSEKKPLTPIMEDDEWVQISANKYLSARCPGLFKKHHPEKDLYTYHHNDRVICHDLVDDTFFAFGLANNVIDEMFPITLPYYPMGQFIVKMTSYSTNNKESKGFFDLVGIHSVIHPTYGQIEINRYFREPMKDETPDFGSWLEIKQEEYISLIPNKEDDFQEVQNEGMFDEA